MGCDLLVYRAHITAAIYLTLGAPSYRANKVKFIGFPCSGHISIWFGRFEPAEPNQARLGRESGVDDAAQGPAGLRLKTAA